MKQRCPKCQTDNEAGELTCRVCKARLPQAFPSPPDDHAEHLNPPVTAPKSSRRPARAPDPPPDDAVEVVEAPAIESSSPRLMQRFELLEQLGEGAMGKVYRARDHKLGEEIAVKMLRAQRHDPELIKRFKTEIVTARRISHPNVIRIHDLGETERDVFISMELLLGGSLSMRLADGPLSLKEAVRIAVGIAEGLSAAHAQDIIHRDLNPSNVLFSESDVPKIVDFGIARLVSAEATQGGFMGTPYYMSPEQADGRDVTFRTDLYSLGVVLFEMVTGHRPFESTSIAELAMMHISQPPPSMRRFVKVPRRLEQLVNQLLAKDPNRRVSDAIDAATQLHSIALQIKG